MGISMRDNMRMDELMVRESTSGALEKSMMVNGRVELRTDMEFGKASMETLTSVNGGNLRPTVMECTHGRMVIVMRESGMIA